MQKLLLSSVTSHLEESLLLSLVFLWTLPRFSTKEVMKIVFCQLSRKLNLCVPARLSLCVMNMDISSAVVGTRRNNMDGTVISSTVNFISPRNIPGEKVQSQQKSGASRWFPTALMSSHSSGLREKFAFHYMISLLTRWWPTEARRWQRHVEAYPHDLCC